MTIYLNIGGWHLHSGGKGPTPIHRHERKHGSKLGEEGAGPKRGGGERPGGFLFSVSHHQRRSQGGPPMHTSTSKDQISIRQELLRVVA